MSDVLALLAELDKAEQKSKPVDVKSNTRKNAIVRGTSQRTPTTRKPRPTSLPPPRDQNLQPSVSPSRPGSSYSERPGSSYTPSIRKLSFADAPRPSVVRRIRIPTRTSALPSGFPYDPRLLEFGVKAEEWNKFSSEIVKVAQGPRSASSWKWAFNKSKVTKSVRQQLLYESSDLMREMKRWNRDFKRQGFQVHLQLPEADEEKYRGGQRDDSDDSGGSSRFCMVITGNSERKPASIYSRSSSLTRTVTGEGAMSSRRRVQSPGMESDPAMFDGFDSSSPRLEARSKSEPNYEADDWNDPSPEPESEHINFDVKDDSDASPLKPESISIPIDEHNKSDISLPQKTESKEEVVEEVEAPLVKTESKDTIPKRPELREYSKSSSKGGEVQNKSLTELLTTAGGFDDWNNMDDDYD